MAEQIKAEQDTDTPWRPVSGQLATGHLTEGGLDRRSPPYGYRVNDDGEWEQIPEQVAIIRRMAEMRLANGASYGAIARRLNAEGIPSPKGGAKGWAGPTVMRILKSGPYWRRPDRAAAQDAWEAIRLAKVAQVTGFLGDEYPLDTPPER